MHHVDFRGKPRPGTDYDVIVTGVQDKGVPDSGNPPQKFSGVSLLAVLLLPGLYLMRQARA